MSHLSHMRRYTLLPYTLGAFFSVPHVRHRSTRPQSLRAGMLYNREPEECIMMSMRQSSTSSYGDAKPGHCAMCLVTPWGARPQAEANGWSRHRMPRCRSLVAPTSAMSGWSILACGVPPLFALEVSRPFKAVIVGQLLTLRSSTPTARCVTWRCAHGTCVQRERQSSPWIRFCRPPDLSRPLVHPRTRRNQSLPASVSVFLLVLKR